MARKNGRTRPREWQPMQPAELVPLTADKRAWLIERLGEAEVEAMGRSEVWKNDRYTVHVERRDNGTVHSLSIKRNDRKPAHDWRHFQRIKNEIAGADIEAVELYPAMTRLLDTSNQYWLWCAEPGVALAIGYERGAVADADDAAHDALGSVQRELPDDWKDLVDARVSRLDD